MASNINGPQKVIVVTTGGTIEKTFEETDGSLKNRESTFRDKVLGRLRLPYTEVTFQFLMAKDSLDLTDEDRKQIATHIKKQFKQNCPIVVLHGTDTMEITAKYCFEELKDVPVPVVFTGAMRPLEFSDTDAFQNVIEALAVSKILAPKFYISFHGRVFHVPFVKKNKQKKTFESIEVIPD